MLKKPLRSPTPTPPTGGRGERGFRGHGLLGLELEYERAGRYGPAFEHLALAERLPGRAAEHYRAFVEQAEGLGEPAYRELIEKARVSLSRAARPQ
jgi:hypothetical protein